MSAGDELFAKALFSNEEIQQEVNEYIEFHLKYLLRRLLGDQNHVLPPEKVMLRNFITEHVETLLRETIERQIMQAFVKERIEDFIKEEIKQLKKEFTNE